MVERECIEARQVDIHPANAHFHRCKAGFQCQTLQFLFGGRSARSAKVVSNVAAQVSSESFTDGSIINTDAIPHADRKASISAEDTAHFPKRERLVGKKLQSLLTQHEVEARIC